MTNTYRAPTDFRAVKRGSDYVLTADGYEFASLQSMMIDGRWYFELCATSSTFGDDMNLDRRTVVCGTDRRSFMRLLSECKAAYLRADRYDWQVAMDERAAEMAERQAWSNKYERDDEAAYWTDLEDRMGLS